MCLNPCPGNRERYTSNMLPPILRLVRKARFRCCGRFRVSDKLTVFASRPESRFSRKDLITIGYERWLCGNASCFVPVQPLPIRAGRSL